MGGRPHLPQRAGGGLAKQVTRSLCDGDILSPVDILGCRGAFLAGGGRTYQDPQAGVCSAHVERVERNPQCRESRGWGAGLLGSWALREASHSHGRSRSVLGPVVWSQARGLCPCTPAPSMGTGVGVCEQQPRQPHLPCVASLSEPHWLAPPRPSGGGSAVTSQGPCPSPPADHLPQGPSRDGTFVVTGLGGLCRGTVCGSMVGFLPCGVPSPSPPVPSSDHGGQVLNAGGWVEGGRSQHILEAPKVPELCKLPAGQL